MGIRGVDVIERGKVPLAEDLHVEEVIRILHGELDLTERCWHGPALYAGPLWISNEFLRRGGAVGPFG